MTEPRQLRTYAYVNRPYETVRAALHQRPLEILKQATTSAGARASSLAASLRVGVGAIQVGVGLSVQVKAVRDEDGVAGLGPVTRVQLGWEAANAASFFPVMSAELSAWPLSATETQLEIEGTYRPPLGAVGTAIDAVVGHRIADASVHTLLEDIVEQLRRELPSGG